MELGAVIERIEHLMSVRADTAAPMASLKSAMRAASDVRAFLAAADADLARRLAAVTSFAEPDIAESTRSSLAAASKVLERGETLSTTPALARALEGGSVTADHVDAVTRAANGLEPDQRSRLFECADELLDVASAATAAQFARRLRIEADRISADGGMARLARQQRATSMSVWTDHDGLWNVRGQFDPVTALSVSAALDRAVEALFAEAVPDTCPSDPVAKQKHLRALAFARLALGTAGAAAAGRPEFIAVIDLSNDPDTDRARTGARASSATDIGGEPSASSATDMNTTRGPGPEVTWPIPIEVPTAVLASLVADADVHTVVVRNGIVLHAPGRLDLGRSTRLANRAQRRALRGMYATCAIPGCTVHYDRCKLHHLIWWRQGGPTDLDNLMPVCSAHHHDIHDNGWNVTLGPNRELTIAFPDGSIRTTGPPSRSAA